MGYLEKLNPQRKGTVPKLVEGAEYALASYGFGYLQNRYRQKASVLGIPADLVGGVVAKSLAIAGDLFGKAMGLTPHLNVIGNAGIGAFCHTLGAGHGGKAAGIRRALVSEGDVAKLKAAVPNATILGEIPKAAHGDLLSTSQLNDLSK